MSRVYNAIILVDYPGDFTKHYASMVERQEKGIETRMKRMIPKGDIVICCGLNSMTRNRGLALCIVHADEPREMKPEDEPKARIECVPGRIANDLSDWRYFSRKFEFTRYKVKGSFQGLFQLRIPDGVEILTKS